MEERHPLLLPLLTTSSPSSSSPAPSPPPDDNPNPLPSNSGIILRLCMVALIGTVSIWANYEASKGYAITVLNESANTFAGSRFQLFYAANDEATRMVIKASNKVENFLYQDSNSSIKKPIKSVIVKLVDHNMTENVVVEMGSCHDQYIIKISPSIMEGSSFRGDIDQAIRRGVARIWLWDGEGKAPKNLINGIVEFLVNSLDGSSIASIHDSAAVCWDSDDRREVAEFLKLGERRRPGFVGRLNEAMKGRWDDEKLSGALGMPVQKLCPISSESSRYNS